MTLCTKIGEYVLSILDIKKIPEILKGKLRYWNDCARRLSKILTEDHEQQRVMAYREFFERYAQEGEDLRNSIVTGDETCVYHFTSETKRQSPSSGDIPIHQRNASSQRKHSQQGKSRLRGFFLGPERCFAC